MILRHFRRYSQQCHCNICAIRYNCRPKGTLFRPFDTMTHYFPMVKLEIDVGLMIDLKNVCWCGINDKIQAQNDYKRTLLKGKDGWKLQHI